MTAIDAVQIERPDLFRQSRGLVRGAPPVDHALTLVKGTHRGPWADPGSDFRRDVLMRYRITVAARVDYWTMAAVRPHRDWQLGGAFLAMALGALDYQHRNLLVHSHGWQVAAHAMAEVKVRSCTVISGPMRPDMEAVYRAAIANCRHNLHVETKDFDRIGFFGRYFGTLASWLRVGQRAPDVAGLERVRIPDVEHSRLLSDVTAFPIWTRDNLAVRLTHPDALDGDAA